MRVVTGLYNIHVGGNITLKIGQGPVDFYAL